MSTAIPATPPILRFRAPPRLALLVSRFNADITAGLRSGALQWLAEHGITVQAADMLDAPGAFELPLLARALARSGRYDGVICLGCVIKGDTAHFEFISLGAATGLVQASLATGVPIAFGILTTYTEAQAVARSRADIHNKGREAAAACAESIALLQAIAAGGQEPPPIDGARPADEDARNAVPGRADPAG